MGFRHGDTAFVLDLSIGGLASLVSGDLCLRCGVIARRVGLFRRYARVGRSNSYPFCNFAPDDLDIDWGTSTFFGRIFYLQNRVANG